MTKQCDFRTHMSRIEKSPNAMSSMVRRKLRPLTPTGMDPTWLKAQLEMSGRSQAALGRFMRPALDASAINRMCKGERQIKVQEAEQIRAYLAATGAAGVSDVASTPFVHAQDTSLLPVVGVVEAGAWREGDIPPPGPSQIPVVASGMFRGNVIALLVQGPSMNEFYPDGSYVIVRRWAGGPFPYGKRVVVQRTKPDGLIEYTIKEIREGVEHPELWPRSTDAAHQTPIAYADSDSVTVEIYGQVVAGLRFDD